MAYHNCWLPVLTAFLCAGSLAAAPVFPADHPLVRAFAGKRLDLWSFQPVREVAVPPMPEWGKNEVDAFTAQLLRHKGGRPAPEADPRVLCRRLFYDLTGLPPAPEEVEAFASACAAAAADGGSRDPVAELTDRLLATDAAALHMTRWWLDLVRYSDTTGYDWDELRRESWRYRGYVVRSFRADKPYDRFVREQLAGDEMVQGAPQDAAQQDALIATGFLRIGPWDNTSKLFGEERRTRAQWMSDLTETTGSALLGLTFSCCRCHDHKYDPLTQADYYRFQAFFGSLEFRDEQPIDLAAEQTAIRTYNASLEQEAKPHLDAVNALREEARKRIPQADRKKKIPDEEADKAMTGEEAARCRDHRKAAGEIESRRRRFTTGLLAGCGAETPVHILAGGNPDEPRDAVEPGIPCYFDPAPHAGPSVPAGQGRRTALADWIFAPENPLTSRVLANRLWHFLFDEGLVASVDDFGLAGSAPAAPELLDWLAAELPRRKWSIRQMLRLMVTSATYRQSVSVSAAEPGLRTLRRLNAEQLRDAMLAVSGRLLPDISGPPVWPELPAEILQANPAVLDDNETKTKGWYPSPADRQGVRSVLLIRKRSLRVPFLETFDLPESFQTCGRRRVSTVAPQALVLMNSSFAAETARAFAARVIADAGTDATAQLRHAWLLALSRSPTEQEVGTILPLWQQHGAEAGCRVLFNLNEFLYVD